MPDALVSRARGVQSTVLFKRIFPRQSRGERQRAEWGGEAETELRNKNYKPYPSERADT